MNNESSSKASAAKGGIEVDCQEFHGLAMDYRCSHPMYAKSAYEALCKYVENLIATTAASAVPADEQNDATNRLHNDIMNLREDYEDVDAIYPSMRYAYKAGHRDARHAAAELALGFAAPSAALSDEVLSLHRQLAAEKLRADLAEERATAKSRECIDLREDRAAALSEKAAPQWISVSDERKPKGRTPILVAVDYVRYGEYEDGTLGEFHGQVVAEGEYVPQHGEAGDYFTCYSSPHGDSDVVTHWMKLPEAPDGTR